MHRFQRFCSGSRTGKPVCGSSGSQPIGLEPEPVMPDDSSLIGSRTANPCPRIHQPALSRGLTFSKSRLRRWRQRERVRAFHPRKLGPAG